MKTSGSSARSFIQTVLGLTVLSAGLFLFAQALIAPPPNDRPKKGSDPALTNAAHLFAQGRQIFRFDTYGDEAFWSDALQLHRAIAGTNFGGVGPGVSPNTALGPLGLKVDVEALPRSLVKLLKEGRVDLNDPAVTMELLKLNAVLGVKGTFNADGSLKSIGLTCAVCHSTVNDSFAPGIGSRLDGFANRDLDVGAVIASAPNLQPIIDALRIVHPTITDEMVRAVLRTWGPGKFDAQLLFDGKATRPDGGPAATLIPNAFGLAGHNLHTWTGGWGSIPYWNALVAVLELRGIGTFFDERLDNTNKYPIAATLRYGHVSVPPEADQVTSKLPALHFYQLALPAPKATAGVDFEPGAAATGKALFNGKANCNSCHREPLWTEPGWNDHTPADLRIDSFQADRSPDGKYRTMNLEGLFIREQGLFMKPQNKGRYYHDGRFQTLLDVVNSYDARFGLGLTQQEKDALVEYLKSL